MNIFGVGLPEIAVIAGLALITFGPKITSANPAITAISGKPTPKIFMGEN